jgi:hypothetical protein
MQSHTLLDDTHPEARRVHIELMRRAPAWRKLQVMDQMNQALRLLANSGLRSRHPDVSEETIRRFLADLLLGPELASKVYGPLRDERAS